MISANELINEELAKKWIQMIGFRNILVHDYTEIDRSEVFGIIQKNLADIKDIRRIFADFL